MTRITQQQLESYLWGAAVLLRGTIDAGDYKQFIFPLLFYKRLCDVFDEEVATALRESGGDQDFALFPENHRFQVPADAHWREIRKVSRDVGRALQQAMRAIETTNPDKLFGIFGGVGGATKGSSIRRRAGCSVAGGAGRGDGRFTFRPPRPRCARAPRAPAG